MERFSRRALVRGGVVAGAALAGGGAAAAELLSRGSAAPPAGARALPRLERGVALGPGYALGQAQRYESNRARFAETGTPWVRLWADWAQLQPEPGRAPHRGSGARVLAALDAQIDAARADGRRIMLTAWRFPGWANGTASLGAAEEAGFRLEERTRPGGGGAHRKELAFRLPAELTPRAPWGRWIDYLLTRYQGRIDALEIMNEPNLQLWPQRAPSGALTIDSAVATMMQTAAALAARRPRAPLLVGPASADLAGDTRRRTAYDTFTRALLDRLAERGFAPGPRFAWSHHNYSDVERDLAGASNRVAQVRAMLAGRWAGWPHADAGQPGLMVTESGARPETVAKHFGLTRPGAALFAQGQLVSRALWRLAAGPEGVGVGLVCQYLFVTDVFFDSGLCELDGTPRPAYFAWAGAAT